MLPKWIVKFKEPKTEIKMINGKFYKYRVEYKYNPEKKRTDKISKELLGRITEDRGFIESEKLKLVNKVREIPSVSILTYGVYNLFSQLMREEINSLPGYFRKEETEIMLIASMMRFVYQSPIKRMSYYFEHDTVSLSWSCSGLSDKKIRATLKYFGEERKTILTWMRDRLSDKNINNGDFVMIDSTHIPVQSENINVNARGYNPDNNHDFQIRLMYIFSSKINVPVYYKLINGNITDVKSMKGCVNDLSLNDIIFIADKGFYSKSNIDALRVESLFYIIPLYRNNSLIDYEPLRKENPKKVIGNFFTYQKRIIWYYEYERDNQKVVTYLDEKLRVEEETDYIFRINTCPEKYSREKYFEILHRFGTLTLVNCLPKDYSAKELYEIYKQRNEIEVMFDAYKNFLEADKTYMQDRYVMEGWLMANFLAIIAYYRLYSLIKKADMLSQYSPKDIVEFSRKIYKTNIRGNWTISETTKKVDKIFKKLGIDYLN